MTNKNTHGLLVKIASIILVGIIIFSARNIYKEYSEYKSSKEKYTDLASNAISADNEMNESDEINDEENTSENTVENTDTSVESDKDSSKEISKDSKNKSDNNSNTSENSSSSNDSVGGNQNNKTENQSNISNSDKNLSSRNESDKTSALKDATNIKVNFDFLRNRNSDVVGWIRRDDEAINYPILKGTDNDFYLTRGFDKQPNKCGSIFIDVKNNADFSDDITLVYGHNMNDGSMFSSLEEYSTKKISANFPKMMIYLPDASYTFKIHNVYLHPGSKALDINFQDDNQFDQFINNVESKSIYSYGEPLKRSDNIVSLVTCENSLEDERIVVLGKLVKN